jgi:hypothetical protein
MVGSGPKNIRQDPALARTYAGLLAASNAMVSKSAVRRPPPAAAPPAGFRPAAMAEIPRLMAGAKEIHRITAAALCYAFEDPAKDGKVEPGGYAEGLLSKEEIRRFNPRPGTDQRPISRYSELFHALHSQLPQPASAGQSTGQPSLISQPVSAEQSGAEKPEILVVNRSAQIISDFDPGGTNISSAKIENYQVLLPRQRALEVLERSHPLNWHDAAPDIFESVGPATRTAQRRWVADPEPDPIAWEKNAQEKGQGIIYEVAVWPWSESVTLRVENAIKIDKFKNDLAGEGGLEKHLSYEYSLESCVRSDYGVITEDLSGLDIDEGTFDGKAAAVDSLPDSHVSHLTVADLRDLVESQGLRTVVPEDLKDDVKQKETDRRVGVAKAIVREMSQQTATEDPWLLTITASKRLRYTVPQYAPVELWATLTWVAPALLFVFLNRAVCQIPQFITDEIAQGVTLKLTKGT